MRDLSVFCGVHCSKTRIFAEIPCFFPVNKEFAFGDDFAEDCLHRQFTNYLKNKAVFAGTAPN
jgi:hypothetical protein